MGARHSCAGLNEVIRGADIMFFSKYRDRADGCSDSTSQLLNWIY